MTFLLRFGIERDFLAEVPFVQSFKDEEVAPRILASDCREREPFVVCAMEISIFDARNCGRYAEQTCVFCR